MKISNVGVNKAADELLTLLNSGFLRLYNGAQPTDADTAITSQVLLAELTFASPAFGSASAGIAVANAIVSDSSANASGTVAWARLVKSDGTTVIMDCTVGTSGTDIIIASTTITSGTVVDCSGLTFTMSKT